MSEQAAVALATAQDQAAGLQKVSPAYRLLAAYHRAMMVAFFYDEDRFAHHAKQMCEYISFGTLDIRGQR